ncbi:MAG: PEP-CTERM sorting domain-containing protein [Planctomycetota bacterium]
MRTNSSSRSERRKKVAIDPMRWASYALAGSAAAFSSQMAEADIHVVDVGVDLIDSTPNDHKATRYGMQLASEASIFLAFAYSSTHPARPFTGGILVLLQGTSGGFDSLSVTGSIVNSIYGYAHALSYRDTISASSMTPFPTGRGFNMAWSAGNPNSAWIDRGGYLAFQFDVGNGSQYGWAELSLIEGARANLFRLERYAWADPGESLFAGQTVPEAGSLGLLAMGAFGLLVWRRNRKHSLPSH